MVDGTTPISSVRWGLAMGRGHNTGPTLYAGETVTVSWDTDIKAQLEAFAKEVREKALRSATFAMANVIYKEIRLRVPVDEGELYAAIYQYHSDRESTGNKQVYYVGVNKIKAPHWHNVEFGHWRYNKIINGKAQKSLLRGKTKGKGPQDHGGPGALDERKWVPARPYMRTAYEASIDRAMQAGKERLAERLKELATA